MKWKKVEERADVKPGVLCWEWQEGDWDVDIHLGGPISTGLRNEILWWQPFPEETMAKKIKETKKRLESNPSDLPPNFGSIV